MGSKLLNFLLIIFSFILSVWVANRISQYYFELKENKGICAKYDVQRFIDSRGYSLLNNRYPKNHLVRHCDKEFDYVYHTDSNGLRVGSSLQKDILAIGDSFTFGFGVQDSQTYPSRLNAYNAGMWGNTFDVQYLSLKENVKLLKPKDIIWGLYPPHLISMTPDQWNKKSPGDMYYQLSDGQKKWLTKVDVDNLNAYPLVKLLMNSLGYKGVKVDLGWLVLEKNPYYSKERLIYNKCMKDTQYTNNKMKNVELSTEMSRAYADLGGYIKDAKEFENHNGVKIHFLLIPSKFYLTHRSSQIRFSTYKGECIDFEYPNSIIKKYIINAGFTSDRIIDLSKSDNFQPGKWEALYFLGDAHWNADGNAAVANIVKHSLSTQKGRL